MDLDEYRQKSRDNWNRIAGNWESEREWIWTATQAVSEQIVEEADPQPGDTVLDLAAGTGDTGFLAAARIGDDGKLITTDFAEAMVDAARRMGAGLGLENVEYRTLDAEDMDLDDDSVDRVVCRFGYMLMADPAKALAETRRVLRDGGRLAFAVWDTPDKNMWAAIPGMVMVERGHIPPPEPGAPGIFALGDTDRIRQLVTGAGFEEPEIETIEMAWPYSDVDAHWDFTMKLAGPLADAIAGMDEGEREEIREEMASRIAPLLEGNGGGAGSIHVVSSS